MQPEVNRRDFLRTSAMVGAAAAVPGVHAAPARSLKIGYTCITWGTFPGRPEAAESLEPALKDISSQGFWGYETFPEVLEVWDSRGQLKTLMERYPVPLISGYMVINVIDPAAAKDSLAKVMRMGKIIRQYGGRFCVMQVDSVKRANYDFAEHR